MAGSVEGLDKAMEAFNKRLKNVGPYTRKAMLEVVMNLHQESVDLAPIDTGDLRGSAQHKVTKEGNAIIGEVSFNTPYALRQHEELDYNHPQGGKAKYLETPFKKSTDKYIKHLGDSVVRAVE